MNQSLILLLAIIFILFGFHSPQLLAGSPKETEICNLYLGNNFLKLDLLLLSHKVSQSQIDRIRNNIKVALENCHVPPEGIDIGLPQMPDRMLPIDFVILANDLPRLRTILEEDRSRDPDFKNLREIANSTPLHFAARYGTPQSLAVLLQAGYNINVTDSFGITPLIAAPGGVEVDANNVKYLVEHGAAINMMAGTGLSPLMSAITEQDLPAVIYLLDHGALIDASCRQGVSAKRIAAGTHNMRIIDLLNEWKNKPNRNSIDQVICNKNLMRQRTSN